ncbi:hypothetical protein K502DRAFT_68370 [Neoconidiobolus thromboides FSU 785]|nr:hypothetical protein K502DRAFT_68370 [Neoconidiobolus thromboides FSU 785]
MRSNKLIQRKARKHRNVLNIHTKKTIVKLAESGLTHKSLAEKFNVARSTITKIILRKDEILNHEILKYDPRKCFKKNQDEKLENLLYLWCTEGQNIELSSVNLIKSNITSKCVVNKANEIAGSLKLGSSDIDSKWIKRFLRKFKLRINKNEEADSTLLSNTSNTLYLDSRSFAENNLSLDNMNGSNLDFSLYDYNLNQIYSSDSLASGIFPNYFDYMSNTYTQSPISSINSLSYEAFYTQYI